MSVSIVMGAILSNAHVERRYVGRIGWCSGGPGALGRRRSSYMYFRLYVRLNYILGQVGRYIGTMCQVSRGLVICFSFRRTTHHPGTS